MGATCFHLLTGIHPWNLYTEEGYSWVKKWRQHLKQSISPQLGTIVDKLLQKEYQQRYQSAGEVLQALVKVPKSSFGCLCRLLNTLKRLYLYPISNTPCPIIATIPPAYRKNILKDQDLQELRLLLHNLAATVLQTAAVVGENEHFANQWFAVVPHLKAQFPDIPTPDGYKLSL